MNHFSESYLDSLEPGDQVYEIEGANDFAFRVFPNGSKTWVFISTEDGYVRRQTLGVYPQTGIREAQQALQMARAAANGMTLTKEAHIDIAKPRAVPRAKATKKRPRLRSKAAIAMTMTALSVGGLLTLQASQDLSPHNRIPEHHLMPITGKIALGQPNAATVGAIPGVAGKAEPKVDGPAEEDVTLESGIGPEPSKAGAEDMPAGEPQRSRNESSSESAGQALPQEPIEESSIRSDVADVTVKRAQFTTGIIAREPVDRIGLVWDAWEDSEERRLIYFFTELGGMNARTAYHRWEHNGKIVSEIPFEVKSSWRWRVFSSKTLLPTMTGLWRATVVDDEGNSLHSESFILPASERFAISR